MILWNNTLTILWNKKQESCGLALATPEKDIKRVLLVQGGLIYPTSKEADKYHFIQMPPMHLNHTD